MNSKHLFIALCFAGLAGATLFTTSCKKVKSSISENEVSAATDNVTADGTSQESQNLAEQAHLLGNGSASLRLADANNLLSSCATITIDTLGTTDTMTIDFGSTPCMCHDMRYREGQMIVSYTGKYHSPGAVIDIHYSNYSVGPSATDLYSIGNSSNKHIVNNGFNGSGFMSWNVTSSMSITKPAGGGTITYNESKVRTQIAGIATSYSSTNKFDISGTASGTAANGTAFTASTASGKDLIRDMSCRKHFTQGELDITPSGASTIAIDFGSGTCDNQATITRNGVTRTITLR